MKHRRKHTRSTAQNRRGCGMCKFYKLKMANGKGGRRRPAKVAAE